MNSLSAQERHALNALEWPLLVSQIAESCVSRPGAEELRALLPATTREDTEARLSTMREALALRLAGHPLPVRDFAAQHELLDRVQAGGEANASELWSLLGVLGLAKELHRYLETHRAEAAALERALDSDAGLERLRLRLAACIAEGGVVLDAASSELARARSKVQTAQAELKRRLGQLIGRFADVLQGQYYTEREGRYVLPVRSDAHLRVDGIVLGSSASGSTLFVEPRELTELGNALRLAEAEAAREEARVLRALSSEVMAVASECEQAYAACISADLLSAATRWAEATDSRVLSLTEGSTLSLRAARHPLLLREHEVVPSDIELAAGRALIISGPNAGGKTIALKTAGLITWMVRAGLAVPVRDDSELGFFEQVFCDIGDEQSIAQRLSTFSAHVRNLRDILGATTRRSLVLLDELAAGTDPEEGAALARAVIEALLSAGAAVLVTTHYERLKELASQDARFANASAGFDFERMLPTFRLQLGVPGPSSALAVALVHGLPEALIERAKSLLPTQALEREAMLRELSRERHLLDAAQRETERDRDQLQEQSQRLQAERDALREQTAHEVERDLHKLRSGVQRARQELEELRAQIRHAGTDPGRARELEREVSRIAARAAVGAEFDRATREATGPALPELEPSQLCVGQTVRHRTLGAEGRIVELCGAGRVRLLIGGMKLLVPSAELEARSGPAPATKLRSKPTYAPATQPKPSLGAQRTQDTTLDLRGERVEAALSRVDTFIDRLLSANESAGFVLHGHGTGALKSSVRDHLRASTYVEHSRPAEPNEGGDAFTVFWLRG